MKKLVLLFSCITLGLGTSAFCQEWSAEQKEALGICTKMHETWANREEDLDELENLRRLEDLAGIEKVPADDDDDDEDLITYRDED